MKRTLSIALTLCMALSLFTVSANAATPKPGAVVVSPQSLMVDGAVKNAQKYNIDGANYFKLRDLAYLLNGTGSQFGVGWDGVTGTVTITTGEAYTPVGGELETGADMSASAVASEQTIKINGETRSDLYVYNIGGANFFKLRDLGTALGFEVDFDAANNAATVATAPAEAGLADENNVARIGSTGYETLAAAVTAAAADQTITLLKDITETVTVPSEKTITLNLNEHKIINAAGQHTIVNNGTLTITGNGTVDNNSNGKGALYNNGTATVNGGAFTRSNSGYIIYNLGTLTIHDGTFTGAISKTGGEISVTGGTFSDASVLKYANDYQLIRLVSEDVMTLETDRNERLEISGELQVCGSLKISGRGTLVVKGLIFVFNGNKDIDLDISDLDGISIGGEERGPILLENGAKLKTNPNWKGQPFGSIKGVDDHNDSNPKPAAYDASNNVYSYTTVSGS